MNALFADALCYFILFLFVFYSYLIIAEQLRGFQVFLSIDEVLDLSGIIPDFSDTDFYSEKYTIPLQKRARFCKIIVPPEFRRTVGQETGPVTLCEVEIFGTGMSFEEKLFDATIFLHILVL